MSNENQIRIGFTGDISFSGYFSNAYKNEEVFTDGVKSFFNENDVNIINQESPITTCRVTRKRRLAHRSSPDVIPFIKKEIKNPIFSLANNHMMDYSRIGMMDTVENMKNTDSVFIGAGENIEEAYKYVILGDKVKVGVFAVQYKDHKVAGRRMSGPFYEGKVKYIRQQISELRQKVDWVVVVYHGGDEFLYSPMPYTRKQLHSYLDMGADLVVAHHPHVVQGYETVGKKMIFYSLGNCMFDTDYQRAQEGTTEGMLLSITFTKDGYTFKNFPVHIDREKQKVEPGKPNEHFIDYANANYRMLWSKEAVHKEEVLQRAAELRKEALAQMAEEEKEKRREYRALRKLYRDSANEDDDTDDENDGAIDDSGDVDSATDYSSGESGLDSVGDEIEEEDETEEAAVDENDRPVVKKKRKKKSLKKRWRRFKKKTKRKVKKIIGSKKTRTYRRGRRIYKLFYNGK